MDSVKKIKVLKKNKRNYYQNKSYKSRIKTFTKKFYYYYKKYLIEVNFFYLMSIKNLFNIIFSLLDKSQKLNIFSKKKVNRKKAQLHNKLNLLLK